MRVLKARAVRAVGMISAGTVQSMRRILSCLEADASANPVFGVRFGVCFADRSGRMCDGTIWMESDRSLLYRPPGYLEIYVLPDEGDFYTKYKAKALIKYNQLEEADRLNIRRNTYAGRLTDIQLDGVRDTGSLYLDSIWIDGTTIPIEKRLVQHNPVSEATPP